MGTLTVTEFISVDGVIDSPGGEPGYRHAGWTFDIDPDPAVYSAVDEAYAGITGLVLGRVTYDGFAAAWPPREDAGGEDAEFAVRLKAGLVDRWHLLVFPVVLGSGKRLFPTDAQDKQKLTLTDQRTFTNGVQLQVLDAVR